MLHDKLTAKSVENFEPNKVQQLKDHNLVMIQAEWCSWCKKTKEEQKNAYGEIKGEDAFLYIQKYRAEPQKTYLKF